MLPWRRQRYPARWNCDPTNWNLLNQFIRFKPEWPCLHCVFFFYFHNFQQNQLTILYLAWKQKTKNSKREKRVVKSSASINQRRDDSHLLHRKHPQQLFRVRKDRLEPRRCRRTRIDTTFISRVIHQYYDLEPIQNSTYLCKS